MSGPNADVQVMKVLRYIRAYVDEHGFPPSRRDIAEHCEVAPWTAQRWLEELRDRGLVRVVAKGPRSMTVTDSGMTALTEVM